MRPIPRYNALELAHTPYLSSGVLSEIGSQANDTKKRCLDSPLAINHPNYIQGWLLALAIPLIWQMVPYDRHRSSHTHNAKAICSSQEDDDDVYPSFKLLKP